MSALCITAAGKAVTLAVATFTLSWTHSVEKTGWRETWAVKPDGLVITESRVRGSGAGMDPGEGARLEDGWWVWQPKMQPVPRLTLAASGMTVSAWTFCADGECFELGTQPGRPAVIEPCDG